MCKMILYQDESLCEGRDCAMREDCLRYRFRPAADEDRPRQRWAAFPPDNAEKTCIGLIPYQE